MSSPEQEPNQDGKLEELRWRVTQYESPEIIDAVNRVINKTLVLTVELIPNDELREELVRTLLEESNSLEELEIRLIQTQYVFNEEKIKQVFNFLPTLKEKDDTGQVTESFLDMWFTNEYGLRDTIKRLLL